MAGFDDVATPVAQSNGFDAVATPYSSPKIPDIGGIQKMAQNNLAANDNKEETPSGELKEPQTPAERLNTAIGHPVSNLLNPADNTPIPGDMRRQYTKATSSGAAVDFGDFAHTMLHAVAPIAESTKGFLGEVGKEETDFIKDTFNPNNAPTDMTPKQYQAWASKQPKQSYLEKLGADTTPFINAAMAPVSGIFSVAGATGQSIIKQAYEPEEWESMAPEEREKALNIGSAVGQAVAGVGVALEPLAHAPIPKVIKDPIAKITGKSPEEVTPADVEQVTHEIKIKAPEAQDFKNVATVTGLPEKMLDTVFDATGKTPENVLVDGQSDPSIPRDIANDTIPEAYEPFIEQRELPHEELQVARSDQDRVFNVNDKEGDFVTGGFNSAEEAQHYINDKGFEAAEKEALEAREKERANAPPVEEKPVETSAAIPEKSLVQKIMDKITGNEDETKAAIEQATQQKPQDVFTPEVAKAAEHPAPPENIYSDVEKKVDSMTPEERDLRLKSLNKKREAAIITPKEQGEYEALKAREEELPPFLRNKAPSEKPVSQTLQNFLKEEEGSGITFRDALGRTITAAEKFTGKLTGNLFEQIADGYMRTFQPELAGDIAKRADAYLAKFKAAGQEAENGFYRQSAASKRAFDKLTPDQRMEWLYDHETGRWTEEGNPDHARMQAMYDSLHEAEQEAGVGTTAYKENYLPHQWENPDAVNKFFRSDAMIKKYGKDWFNKASEFRLVQEGVQAGFKLKTDNPESMLVARQQASFILRATMDLMRDLERDGIAKRATVFSIDKKIAKTQAAIDELQAKYKKEFEKKNNPQQGTLFEKLPPAESKLMKLVEGRLSELKERLDNFNKEKSENKLTPAQLKELKDNGFKVIGPDNKVWNIHEQAAPVWKNAMEMKGLWERQGVLGDAYRTYTQGKALWVRTKLLASLFHPGHVAVIDISSDMASAAHHLIQGGKLSDLGANVLPNLGLTKETARLQDHPQIQAWNTKPEDRTPQQHADVQRMVEGGFVPTISERDKVRFRENFEKGIKGVGKNNLRLIGTALETPGMIMAPMFEHWIPGMKTDSYFQRTELALKRDPILAEDAGKRGEVFRQIAQDIDRNYGEMNSKTQFWNPIVRDAFNASFLSGGWKLAMLQNFRGLLEPAHVAYNFAKTGEFSKASITHQMLQSYIYTANMLMLGAGLNYLFTGAVGTLKDWMTPQTGDKNPDGTPIRLSPPAFFKEPVMLLHDINSEGAVPGTGTFLYHQSLIPGIMDTLNNRDFVGRTEISDPTDLNQWKNAGWDFIKPINFSNQERAEQKGSKTAAMMGWAGFPIAGAYNNQTSFEQKVLYTYDQQNPPKGDVYQAKLKSDLKTAVAQHDSKAIEETKALMKKEGMTEHQISNAEKPYTKPFVDQAWKELPVADQKRLIESASDEEKKKFKVKSAQ